MAIRYYDTNKVRRPKTIAIVTGIISVLLLSGVGVVSFNTYNFLGIAVSTRGEVVAMQVDKSGDTTNYLPMFTFTDENGQAQRVPGFQQSPDYGFAKGEMVDILYDPADLSVVRIDNWQDTWKPSFNILLVAAFFMFMCIGSIILHRRWMRDNPDYANRDDFFPDETAPDEHIYFSRHGRIRFLKDPKRMTFILGVPGLFMLLAGIYAVVSGADFGQEDQAAAFFTGAAMFLGLAAYTWRIHIKWSRAKARAEAKQAE